VTLFWCSRCKVRHAGECQPKHPRQPPIPAPNPCAREGCGDGAFQHYGKFGCSVAFCGCPEYLPAKGLSGVTEACVKTYYDPTALCPHDYNWRCPRVPVFKTHPKDPGRVLKVAMPIERGGADRRLYLFESPSQFRNS
jgi:hypothetical protein